MRNRGVNDSYNNQIDYDLCRIFYTKYCIDLSQSDIVYGYRADDSYFSIITAFVLNQITANEVVNYFYLRKLGKQVFIKSKDAFNQLKFGDSYSTPQKN